MSLLSLPPELLLQIFRHVVSRPVLDPREVTALTLVHPTLTSIAHQLVFLDLVLHSDRQVELLLASRAFHDHAHLVTTLRFDATAGTSIGTGGIGSEPTITGNLASQVLEAIERSTRGTGRLRELDLKDCVGLKSSALQGTSLNNLRKLTIGAGIVVENASMTNPLLPPYPEKFYFRLTDSLTVTNNHWQSLPTSFLSSLVSQTCRDCLRTLDLSTLYSVESMSPLLDSSLDLFASVENLYLPPFETLSQIIFSALLLDDATATGRALRYVEFPAWSDPRENVLLLPFLEAVARNRDALVEVGFKHAPSPALLDSVLVVLQSLYGGPPGSGAAEASGCRVDTFRMVKLRGTAHVSETMEREGELIVDLIGQFGCDIEYGEYRPHSSST
ncbi:hypothetical protein JCM11491_000845 [Sporobolomyces phaffii]